MKKNLLIFFALMLSVLTSCGNDAPEVTDGMGLLIVIISQEGSDTENLNFSDYSIALTEENGIGWTAPKFSEISWPIDVKVGTYTVSVSSPMVSETETTETYYFGEATNIKINNNKTTEITVTLRLHQFPKSNP